MSYKEKFIYFMVESGVLTFGDFTTKSGRKTPYFINTGNYRTGRQMKLLGEFYADAIMDRGCSFDFIFGPAYKGISLAVTTAAALYDKYQMDIPFCFNRKEIKDHGEGGSIIGHKPEPGQKVLIIEDVITAGTSVRESVPLLKGMAPVTFGPTVISVDRLEKGAKEKTAAEEVKEEFDIDIFSIVTIMDILSILYKKEINGKVLLDEEMKKNIEAYMGKYCTLIQ